MDPDASNAAPSARVAVRRVLRDMIVGYLKPVELPEGLPAAEPLRLIIDP